METNMVKILKKINKYEYFVLRDYDDENKINNCSDVDMYVSEKDINKVQKILEKEGFVLQKNIPCKYPHLQYKKISDRIYRFDVVTKLMYGKNQYYFIPEKNNLTYETDKTNFDVKIPNKQLAIYTMLLHILFDKNDFSEKNYTLMQNLIKKEKTDNDVINKIIEDIRNNDIEKCNNNIQNYQKLVLDNNIMKSNPAKKYCDFKILIKKIYTALKRRLERRNVAVIGVDGSGKSTTIEELHNILGSESIIVYMGLKNFKFKYCKDNESFQGLNGIQKLKYYTLLYIDFLCRYFKYRYTSKIVIFDRYIYDTLANDKKPRLKKILDDIFYKVLYPKPKLIYYLHCDVETSLKRKNDINDVERFNKYKNNYDRVVKKNKKIKEISSNRYNNDQIIQIIAKDLNKYKY